MSNPMWAKMSQISRLTRVTGCSVPQGSRRPGSVTSILSPGPDASASADASAASISVASRSLSSFACLPASGRWSAGNSAIDRRNWVSAPLRPRYLTWRARIAWESVPAS